MLCVAMFHMHAGFYLFYIFLTLVACVRRCASMSNDRPAELEDCFEALEEELLGDDGKEVGSLACLLTQCAAEGNAELKECTGPTMLLATVHGLGAKLVKCLFDRAVAAGGPINYPAHVATNAVVSPATSTPTSADAPTKTQADGDAPEKAGGSGGGSSDDDGRVAEDTTPECRAAISAIEAHLELTTSQEILAS